MAMLLQQLSMNSSRQPNSQQQPLNDLLNAMKMGSQSSGGAAGAGDEGRGTSLPPPLPLMNALKLEDLEKF